MDFGTRKHIQAIEDFATFKKQIFPALADTYVERLQGVCVRIPQYKMRQEHTSDQDRIVFDFATEYDHTTLSELALLENGGLFDCNEAVVYSFWRQDNNNEIHEGKVAFAEYGGQDSAFEYRGHDVIISWDMCDYATGDDRDYSEEERHLFRVAVTSPYSNEQIAYQLQFRDKELPVSDWVPGKQALLFAMSKILWDIDQTELHKGID